MKYNFDISTGPRYESNVEVEYNPIENEFIGLWATNGPLRDDCGPGDMYECTNSFKSIDGRRISPDGEILGDPIQLSPPELGEKHGPRFAHNIFTNQYMLAMPIAPTALGADMQMYIAGIDSVGNFQYGPKLLYDVGGGFAFLPEVIFNSVRREYLVVYNDYNVFNVYQNNVGFILDENGNPIHGPFPVGNHVGDAWRGAQFYASRGTYNPTNDTYLVVWEDFRYATDWLECDMYGTLLDADGNMIVESPIMDDHGTLGIADQRVPVPCYNPNRNEFLVVWRDFRPSLDNYGIMGRFIGADGTLKGPEFVVIDPPGMQGIMELLYIEEEKKYFANWTDTRNATEPGLFYFLSDNADIYAIWLDESGSPIGDEIPICVEPDVQMHAKMDYDPVKKRFLIAWYDYNAPNDYGAEDEPTGISSDGDIRGTIYGVPQTKNPCLSLKIYGDHSEEVELLRYVRDSILSQTPVGQEIIRLY
ncbi:MAG: hypothetical protein V3R78_07010, partial [Thermodesulfobacteriota bacterium]